MGMHFGVVTAEGSVEQLLEALSAAGTFRAGHSVNTFDDAPEADAAGERTLIAGDHVGGAYLLDESLILSANPDLIVDASRRLGGRVIAVGAETTSGTYFLIAAKRGDLERFHWTQIGGLERAYDLGEPLAGEPEDGLDDVDGQRLMGVLAAAGFDMDAWGDSGRKVVVDATYGEPVTGEHGEALNSFFAANEIAGSAQLKPVVASRGGGFDLVAPGSRLPDGTRVAGEKQKSGLIGRLFGRS